MSRSTLNFILALVSFWALLGLSFTGLIMRYMLPPGSGGMGRLLHGGAGRGVTLDFTSPIEPIFASEMAHAVAGMTRKEVNKIVQSLLAKYEDKIRTPPPGKKYQECFDATAGMPIKEYNKMDLEVRKEMADEFGIQLKNTSPFL